MTLSNAESTGFTAKIGQFVSETAAKDIPENALDQARLAIMDYIGVSLAGSREELGRIVVDYAKSMGGGEVDHHWQRPSDFPVSCGFSQRDNGARHGL